MSGFGVEPEDMTRATVIDDKLEALLGGGEPAAGDELGAELAFILEELDSAFPAAVVSEQVEDLHIARMVEAAGESVAPVTAPLAPVRTSLLDRMRAAAARKVAAASLAFTAAFGGAAYAGVLPAPVQRAVANAAGAVGLELPRPGDDGHEGSVAGDRDDREDREAPEVTEGRADSDYRRGADAVAERDGRGTGAESGSDNEGTRGSRDGGSEDARGELDDDDSDDRDDDDADDDGDGRSGRAGAVRDSDDDDDEIEYEAPERSRDSDRDDATEPEDDEESSFDSGDDRDPAESDRGDELGVDSDAVEDPSDD